MTAKQLSALTLADIEAIAERLGAAARTIRDAQALLGGGAPVEAQLEVRPTAPAPPALKVRWTPAEQAERERLLSLNRPDKPEDYPPEIAAAMKESA